MRRRTLLAAGPAVALLPAVGFAQSGQPKSSPAPGGPPPVWEAGEDRFPRPDVHQCDNFQLLQRKTLEIYPLCLTPIPEILLQSLHCQGIDPLRVTRSIVDAEAV